MVVVSKRVKMTDIFLDPDNARSHPEVNVLGIKESLKEFGQVRPLLVQSGGRIIAGNGTYLAMKELDFEDVNIDEFDCDDLTAKRLSLAMNRLQETSEWNYLDLSESFKDILSEGGKVTNLGWKPEEIEAIMSGDWQSLDMDDPNQGGGTKQSDEPLPEMRTILVTLEQYQTIEFAAEKIKTSENRQDLSMGRILELLAAHWLSFH